MAVVQLRTPTEGRTYYDRKTAAGKTTMEAMRCLKRRLSDLVYRTMLTDYLTVQATGPGGHRGTTLTSGELAPPGSTSATMHCMKSVGLRELRQDASDLVRRVQAGEEITITVSGRPSARLVPAHATQWRSWGEIADLFRGPDDRDWEQDRQLLDHDVRDPWVGQ